MDPRCRCPPERLPEERMDTAQTAPPQLSPDGHWWWNGQEWVPAPAPAATVAMQPQQSVQAQQPQQAVQPVQPAPQLPAAWTDPVVRPYVPARGTDGLAIASLVCALVSLGFGSIAAVILGHKSRGRAIREGRAP